MSRISLRHGYISVSFTWVVVFGLYDAGISHDLEVWELESGEALSGLVLIVEGQRRCVIL